MFNEWWLARDKGQRSDVCIIAYPTEWTGIVKKKGCIDYRPTNKNFRVAGGGILGGWFLLPENCKQVFGHCPKKGELLCVKKTRKGWKCEKIDLEFS